jgi:hypothetical protein
VNEVEEALRALRDFMNAIASAFGEAATAYERFISRDDGEDLVLLLRMAHRYRQLQDMEHTPWDDIRGAAETCTRAQRRIAASERGNLRGGRKRKSEK